jgi:hypothetical protein|nr:MAG TPA: helix-turn-helix domain protein [Caudoviricetes sp.]
MKTNFENESRAFATMLAGMLELKKQGYTDEEVQKAVGIFSNSKNNEHSDELYDIIEKLLDRIENLEKRLGVKA